MARYFRIERCEADNFESSSMNFDDTLTLLFIYPFITRYWGSETDLAA